MIVSVITTPAEITAHELFKASQDSPKDHQFVVRERRFLRHPDALVSSFWVPKSGPSSANKAVINLVRKMLDEDKDKPVRDQRKVVLFSTWTGLIPFTQLHLSRAGIFSSSLTGDDSPETRQTKIREFQQDADHPVDRVAEMLNASQARIFPEDSTTGGRVMIISGVGSAGITLHRGSTVVLTDPVWSYADVRQIVGRMPRIGQRFTDIRADMIVVKGTCEERLLAGPQYKKMSSDAFLLGKREQGDLKAQPASASSPPQEKDEAADLEQSRNSIREQEEEKRARRIASLLRIDIQRDGDEDGSSKRRGKKGGKSITREGNKGKRSTKQNKSAKSAVDSEAEADSAEPPMQQEDTAPPGTAALVEIASIFEGMASTTPVDRKHFRRPIISPASRKRFIAMHYRNASPTTTTLRLLSATTMSKREFARHCAS